MSRKVRSQEEVEEILRCFALGESIVEISQKFKISEAAFYRILKVSRGQPPEPSRVREQAKVEKLEKKLREREKEIALLKAALKKS